MYLPSTSKCRHVSKTHNLTWKGPGFLMCRKCANKNLLGWTCSHGRCLASCEEQNLARRANTKKLQLNLGPIISAPAAKGNFLTGPHNSHRSWGDWGYGDTLEATFSWSLTGCLGPLSQFCRQSTSCLWDACLTPGHVSFLNSYALIQTVNGQNTTRGSKAFVLNDLIVGLQKRDLVFLWSHARDFHECFFTRRCSIHTMQSELAGYFHSVTSLPLSLISVTQLWQETEANQLPGQDTCRVTHTLQRYSRGERKKWVREPNWQLETIIKWFSHKRKTTVSLCHGTSTIKKHKCPNKKVLAAERQMWRREFVSESNVKQNDQLGNRYKTLLHCKAICNSL